MSIGLEPNVEMIAEENLFIKTFISSYIERIAQRDSFNTNKIDDLKFLLDENLQPFSRIDTLSLLNQGEVLTAQQKRELGLNTRLKIRSGLLEYLNLDKVDKEKPFDFITETDFYSRARGWSEREINRAKKFTGSKLSLDVMDESCPNSKPYAGIYSVNDAPLLPLPTCGKRCLCMYLIKVGF